MLTISQLKTLIMQLRKICNHPRTLLGGGKGAAASSRAPMGGGGKAGERLRAELAALTGEDLIEASGPTALLCPLPYALLCPLPYALPYALLLSLIHISEPTRPY